MPRDADRRYGPFLPAQLDAEALIGLLRPLTPRLYSIASSQAEVESEVHVTVGVVRYDIEGRARAGGASSFLADRVEEDGEVRVFIEHNDNFRLPANPETPVIMIGPGTGIAPFRAFMQQRARTGGRQELAVLRQPALHRRFPLSGGVAELCQRRLLTRIDLAWSRDQQQKVYVQDKLREQGPSCGAGSMTAPTFMSAATPIVWRKTWSRRCWK
jgi:sulfite reductase (NADPH) flavoprotein alpha-component